VGKIVRTVVLMAAMAGLAVGLSAPAQEKKGTKDAKAGTVEVWEAKDGYRFKVLDADGKTVAMSAKAYDKADDAKKALEYVKHTLNTVKVTEVKGEKK
jgi:hypothetical protein